MDSIFEAMTAYFKADNWPIHPVDEFTYSMTFQGQNGTWACVAQACEDDREFIFYSACPKTAPADRRHNVAELLTRINYTLDFGNFEMNFEHGDIRFRTSIDITEGHNLGAMLIGQVVYRNVLTMDYYLLSLLTVIDTETSPIEAIAQLEMQLDSSDKSLGIIQNQV